MTHVPPRTRFRRFGLRTLLALTALVAVFCGYVGNLRRQYWFEQEVARGIRELGGVVHPGYFPPVWLPEQEVEEKWFHRIERIELARATRDLDESLALKFGNLSHLKAAYLDNTRFSDDALQRLAKVSTLESLHIQETLVTDQGLSYVARMRNVRSLSVGSPKITDGGLQHLSGLKKLVNLDLAGSNIRGPGLAQLANPSGGSEQPAEREFHLNVADCKIDDEGLKHLSHLTATTTLNLSANPLGDEGLVHLAAFHNLRRLELVYTNVTGDGLKRLQALTQLADLHVSLSDYDLEVLAGFKNLKSLRIRGITDAGLERLPELPDLKELTVEGGVALNWSGWRSPHLKKWERAGGTDELGPTEQGIERLRERRPDLEIHWIPGVMR